MEVSPGWQLQILGPQDKCVSSFLVDSMELELAGERAPRWGPQPVVLENGSVGYLVRVTSEACLRLTHQGKQNLHRENRCMPLSALYAVTWGW